MIKILIPVVVAILVFSFLHTNGQTKEFEGVIKYKHEVIAKDSNYDVSYDYSGIGKYSEYYFKNGDYKFVNHDCYFSHDLFKSESQKNYLGITNSDTILCMDSRVADVRVIDITIRKNADTILNYPCDVIALTLKPLRSESPVSYRRYYFSTQLAVNPNHFKGCKANAYDVIYENSKALALKIEFEWPDKLIEWKAYEVLPKKLNDNIFEVQKNWIIQNINYNQN